LSYWQDQLDELKIPYWNSQGNFLLIDVRRGLGMSGPEVYNACLRLGAIFRPVANYGMPDYLRISIGTEEENRIGFRALSSCAKAVKPVLGAERKKKSVK
jgi:histidinol-phosphate aminotransferase